ncbi:translesion error-prone DNA polymerase V subunit UmuC [soil metagenome]
MSDIAMSDLVALVDCNNFYASCERVFQPALRGRPVVVLSNNDGCVIARSNEAKALGIEMGAPWHLHRARFEQQGVIVRSSNYTLYGDMSARVMEILSDFTSRLEVYSIDEAFIAVSGTPAALDAHVRRLRATVLQWTGLPVSIGIASTKVLAKVANRLAKKDAAGGGVRMLLTPVAEEDALRRLALTDLWGVARRMATRLQAQGFDSPLALRAADPGILRERFGVVMQRLALELRGIACHALELVVPDRKSIMSSRSFGQPITARTDVEEAVTAFTSRAAAKMRSQALVAGHVTAFIETNPFREEAQYRAAQGITLPVATADTAKLVAASQRALAVIWRDGFRYKKAGVMLLDLVKANTLGGGLFDRSDDPRSHARMRALDGLNARFGRDALRFGNTAEERPWRLRSDRLSPRYTSRWDELLVVSG